jgi:hypothetical protein
VALVVDTREHAGLPPPGVPCCASLDGAQAYVAAVEALAARRAC